MPEPEEIGRAGGLVGQAAWEKVTGAEVGEEVSPLDSQGIPELEPFPWVRVSSKDVLTPAPGLLSLCQTLWDTVW